MKPSHDRSCLLHGLLPYASLRHVLRQCWLAQVALLQTQLEVSHASGAQEAHQAPDVQLQQLQSAWDHREATTNSLRQRAEALHIVTASLAMQTQNLFAAPDSRKNAFQETGNPTTAFQSALSNFASSLRCISQSLQLLPRAGSQAATSDSAQWEDTVFTVSLLHSLLNVCFNEATEPAVSDSASDGLEGVGLTASSGQAVKAEQLLHCLEATLAEWSRNKLQPRIVKKLVEAADNGIATGQGNHVLTSANSELLPSGDDDFLQDLSYLALEGPGVLAEADRHEWASAEHQLEAHSPELRPFNDFNTRLQGADQSLDSGLEDAPLEQQAHEAAAFLELEPAQSADTGSSEQPTDAFAADLVPFSDFDDALAGADDSLEADTSSVAASNADARSSSPHCMGDQPTSSALPALSPEARSLSEAMLQYIQCAGKLATAEQQEVAVATVQDELQLRIESQQESDQLVAFEWMHGNLLEEALQMQGGLGQPALVAPKVSQCCAL